MRIDAPGWLSASNVYTTLIPEKLCEIGKVSPDELTKQIGDAVYPPDKGTYETIAFGTPEFKEACLVAAERVRAEVPAEEFIVSEADDKGRITVTQRESGQDVIYLVRVLVFTPKDGGA